MRPRRRVPIEVAATLEAKRDEADQDAWRSSRCWRSALAAALGRLRAAGPGGGEHHRQDRRGQGRGRQGAADDRSRRASRRTSPPAASRRRTRRRRLLGGFVDPWPTNPFSNAPMKPGTARATTSTRPAPARRTRSAVNLSDGSTYTRAVICDPLGTCYPRREKGVGVVGFSGSGWRVKLVLVALGVACLLGISIPIALGGDSTPTWKLKSYISRGVDRSFKADVYEEMPQACRACSSSAARAACAWTRRPSSRRPASRRSTSASTTAGPRTPGRSPTGRSTAIPTSRPRSSGACRRPRSPTCR